MRFLQKEDLSYEADRYGYQIKFLGHNIGGAGVMGKPKMHWKHARQNAKDNAATAQREIDLILSGHGQQRFYDAISKIEVRPVQMTFC